MRQLLLWDAISSLFTGRQERDAGRPGGEATRKKKRRAPQPDGAVPVQTPTVATPTGHDHALWPSPSTEHASGDPRAGVHRADDALAFVDTAALVGASTAASEPAGAVPAATVEFVRHPRARRYLIRVRLDGTVRVTIPRRGSKREAVEFYEQQRQWVAEHQRRVAQARASIPQDLSVHEQRVLRARAKRELPPRLLELARVAGVTVRKVSVRSQRQRWGSCSASGLICLNWRLVTMPDWVRDYVLFHELMHLKRMDHSPAFWALVASVCPNYQSARRWLRRHALAPHSDTAHRDLGDSGVDPDVDTPLSVC